MVVSSRHVMLASRVFNAILQVGFTEGDALKSVGRAEIEFLEDDPAAFTTLMNIIHGKGHNVPCTVTFEKLLDLAKLVDKYDLHECVFWFSEGWIQSIKDKVPTYWYEDVIPWIAICWGFHRSVEFESLTRIAIKTGYNFDSARCQKQMATCAWLPDIIFETIKEKREKLIAKTLGELQSWLLYPSKKKEYKCLQKNKVCPSMTVGTILISASKRKLWPL
ncbi:hypothetical protein B0J14DRAFT_511031, partial [Halenospora varia]